METPILISPSAGASAAVSSAAPSAGAEEEAPVLPPQPTSAEHASTAERAKLISLFFINFTLLKIKMNKLLSAIPMAD